MSELPYVINLTESRAFSTGTVSLWITPHQLWAQPRAGAYVSPTPLEALFVFDLIN